MKNILFKIVSVVLSLCLFLVSFTACKKKDSSFPELSYPDISSEISETIESTIVNDNQVLGLTEFTVALPYSEYTIDMLLRLYFAKQQGLFSEDMTGKDVTLEFLDSIEVPWVVHSILTPSDGISYNSVSSYQSNGRLPDIMLVSDLDSFADSNLIAPLNSNVANSHYFNSSNINSQAIISNIDNGVIYGIPHYMSIVLLAGNLDFQPNELTLSFRPELDEFTTYMSSIYEEHEEDEDFVVFPRAYELMPYLSSAFNSDQVTPYFFNDDGEMFEGSDDAVQYVQSIYDEGYSSMGGSTDSRFSRTSAIWLVSSAEVPMWSDYYLGNLYFTLLPCSDNSSEALLYSSVYSVCVSNACENRDLAADFASFISLDSDALELILRLEPQSGYFPVVNNADVWDLVYGDIYLGTEAIVIQQYISNSVVSPALDSDYSNSVNSYCSNYFENPTDDAEFNFEEAIND